MTAKEQKKERGYILGAKKRRATMLAKYGKDAYKIRAAKTAATNKERYGDDYYAVIGKKGGEHKKGVTDVR